MTWNEDHLLLNLQLNILELADENGLIKNKKKLEEWLKNYYLLAQHSRVNPTMK